MTSEKRVQSFCGKTQRFQWELVASEISRELAAYFSLEITQGLNRLFMCCHWITKPKFNDVYVLLKHSNFCSRMLKLHSKKHRFQNFPETRAFAANFFLLHLLQNFCYLLKILQGGASRNVGWYLRLGGEKQGEESRQFPLPFRSFPHSAQECSQTRASISLCAAVT